MDSRTELFLESNVVEYIFITDESDMSCLRSFECQMVLTIVSDDCFYLDSTWLSAAPCLGSK